MEHGPFRYRALGVRASWPERLLAMLATVALVILGFFFLAAALVAGSILALVIIGRWWWLTRKLRRARDQDVFEGEYTIVERRERRDRVTPPDQ